MAGLLVGLSVLVKLLGGLIFMRVLARAVGPSGLGIAGQFMGLAGIVTLLAAGGIGSGLIRYVAQHRENKSIVKMYLQAGSAIAVLAGLTLALGLGGGAGFLSRWLFGTGEFARFICALACFHLFAAANVLALSVISGHQDTRGFAMVNILANLLSLGLAYGMTQTWGQPGALLWVALAPALPLVLSLPYAFRRGMLAAADLVPRLDPAATRNLLAYSGMLCVSAVTLPLAQTVVRRMMVARFDWAAVGYWQGVSRLSDAYLQFLTVLLINHYLPELASAGTRAELRARVFRCMKLVIPAVALMGIGIFVLKDLVIRLIFPSTFVPMRAYFLFQLMGDTLKIATQTLAYIAVAKALTAVYVVAEIVQALLFVGLSRLCLGIGGPLGVTWAHALTYLVQLGFLLLLLGRQLRKEQP